MQLTVYDKKYKISGILLRFYLLQFFCFWLSVFMQLLVIGLNHKTAPVALREQLAFGTEEMPIALTELQGLTAGSVIVSTCNRTELYVLTDGQTDLMYIKSTLTHWLANFKRLSSHDITPHLYFHDNTLALTHWLRVASGLDSMILGEPQILGQIKQAAQIAETTGSVSPRLKWVIQQIFAATKIVRSETQVGSQAVSLGFAASRLVTQIFDKPQDITLLVVAAGEMNRLVATNMMGLGISRVIICNRGIERAENLASELMTNFPQAELSIEVVGLDRLSEVLVKADVITCSSGSLHTLIDKKMVKTALKQRRYQPMLMIDLAVPRDIEPSVGELDDVYLYSIDDLQHVIAGNLEKRRQAAVEAELLVSQLVVGIERRFAVHQVGQEIKDYRQHAQDKANELLQLSLAKLDQGQPAESVLAELTHKLTQNLTHAPSKLLRKTASEANPDTVAFVVESLKEAYRD